MKISLNELLNLSVCSYWGPLNIAELIYEDLEYDVDEFTDKDGYVNVYIGDKKQKVKKEEIDSDFEFFDGYEKLVVDYLTGYIDDVKLTRILKKYWITKKGYSLYKPMYYNFEMDSLDMELECDYVDWKKEFPELIEDVKYYIDNIRKKSCDGYQSFEPSNIDEVDVDDYCFIRAVLKHENLLDELKQNLEWWIEDVLENRMEFVWTIEHKYKNQLITLDN